MNFMALSEGLKKLTENTALEMLSKEIPFDSFQELNEPIDLYGIYAKDAPTEGLDKEAIDEIKKKNAWPDSIVDNIRTSDEAEIYKHANLKVESIDGKDCLIRSDIEYDLSIDGQTNLERMKEGKCPYTADGQQIELHHIGQNHDAPLAELTTQEHRSVGNDMILHDKTIDESKIDRGSFRAEREKYWRTRAQQIENERNGK